LVALVAGTKIIISRQRGGGCWPGTRAAPAVELQSHNRQAILSLKSRSMNESKAEIQTVEHSYESPLGNRGEKSQSDSA